MLLKLLMGIGIGSWLALPVVSRADTLNFTLSEPNNTSMVTTIQSCTECNPGEGVCV